MSLVIAWLVFPLLLGALAVGNGLAVARLGGRRVPGVLLAPLGLATIVVLARGAMSFDATAELAPPLVLVVALAGLWLGRDRLRAPRLDWWAAAAALVVFAIYAAPTVLSGSASFAGYTVLGDTAIHFTLIDRIAEHGTSLAGLEPSSYRQALESYFGSGYPLGTHAALGAVRPLVFTDVAWLFQPYLAFIAAMLVLTLVGLLRGVVRSGWRVAAVAALAAQPALVYAYALQGSVKEIATLWLIPLIAAFVACLADRRDGERGQDRVPLAIGDLVPLAIVSAAAIAAIGLAAAVWLGPMLLVALWVVARGGRLAAGRVALLAAGFAAIVAVISLPTLRDASDYLDVAQEVVTTQTEVGNLAGPLSGLQVAGIWLTGDYRFLPVSESGIDALELTYLAIGLAAVAALFGALWLVRRRALGPLLFVVSSLIALWYVMRSGSPWADAKALAIASPAVLLLAALGPVALEARGARIEAALVAIALAAGVLGSNALAYHDVSLAPRDRLEELAEAGELAAGNGPLLYTEFEEFGKHFLRDAQPVGASEAFYVPGLTPGYRGGGGPTFGQPADLARIDPVALSRFGTLVQRRSPYGERPPRGWRRVWAGRYYELWRNDGRGGAGTPAVRTCARPTALVAADRPLPSGWAETGDSPPLVQTAGQGLVTGTVDVRVGGRYEVWLSGSFGRDVAVRIDSRDVGSVGDELSQPASWIDIGALPLARGRHRVEIIRGGGDLEPGNGDGRRVIGSVVLRPLGSTARAGC